MYFNNQQKRFTGWEPSPLVTMCEFNGKEGNKRMDIIIPPAIQLKRCTERQVFFLHSMQVNFLQQGTKKKKFKYYFKNHVFNKPISFGIYLYETGIRNYLLSLHHIHKRLCQGNFPDTAHIKAINIVPPCKRNRKWSFV